MKIKLKPINEQAAVVFGASSGIGRITALELGKKGAKVFVAARSEAGLQSLVEEIRQSGGEAFYRVADAADFAQVQATADEAFEKFGRIDTWIHSAAAFLFAPVEKTEPEEYERLIAVNLLGQIYGAKAALSYLKKQGGALIHVSSVEAWRTVPYQSAYGASKHGIHGFIQTLRVEIKHDKIPVSVTQVLPAAINTPIYDKGRSKMPYKPRPLPPVYHPKIVADAILYACENPVAELIAGGAGAGVVAAERISPTAAEWVSGAVGFAGQKSDENLSEEFAGSLFEPIGDFDTVEGRFSGEQFKSDPYTFLQINPPLKNALLALAGGLLGALIIRKTARKRQRETISPTKSKE